MKAQVAIVGPSGSGKSRSIKGLLDLPDKKILIVNVEDKILPFPHKGLEIRTVNSLDELKNVFKEAESFDIVVLDSLSEISDMMVNHCTSKFSGYDIWAEYGKMLQAFLRRIKSLPGITIVISIDEIQEVNQVSVRCIRAAGKQYRGKVEEKFSIVLFTEVVQDEGGNRVHRFRTQSNGFVCAKSPEGMLPEVMENNLGEVVRKMEGLYANV